jgi:hypothetical protein
MAIESKALLDDVFDEEFGLRLSNFSIKPVHIANGLSRALTGRTYETIALNKSFRRYVRNQKLGVDEERNPNSAVLSEFKDAFEPLRGAALNDRKLTRLRALALNVFGADDGVYEQPDKSSFTLSNERFVTKDPSDMRAGSFLARLLTEVPKVGTDAADVLRDLLRSETDAWTTLALPLLEFGGVCEEAEGSEGALRVAKGDHLFAMSHGHFASATLRTLRNAYDRLARFERTSGSKLNSLRRLILFGCFVLHVHVISRWSERDPQAPRPPMLLDLFYGTVVSVRDASRSTLRASGDAIEGLIRASLREIISNEYGSTASKIEKAIVGSESVTQLQSAFNNYLAGGTDPAEAIAHAVADEAFAIIGEHPIGALTELGRRAGFLSPWANQGRGGKLQKRYTATAEFLETLIASSVDPEEPLEFPEFLDRLRDIFGIVLGRPEDDLVIRQNNLRGQQFGPITSINEEDLRENVEAMRRLVIESGYGKAYADGRTLVTTRVQGFL